MICWIFIKFGIIFEYGQISSFITNSDILAGTYVQYFFHLMVQLWNWRSGPQKTGNSPHICSKNASGMKWLHFRVAKTANLIEREGHIISDTIQNFLVYKRLYEMPIYLLTNKYIVCMYFFKYAEYAHCHSRHNFELWNYYLLPKLGPKTVIYICCTMYIAVQVIFGIHIFSIFNARAYK